MIYNQLPCFRSHRTVDISTRTQSRSAAHSLDSLLTADGACCLQSLTALTATHSEKAVSRWLHIVSIAQQIHMRIPSFAKITRLKPIGGSKSPPSPHAPPHLTSPHLSSLARSRSNEKTNATKQQDVQLPSGCTVGFMHGQLTLSGPSLRIPSFSHGWGEPRLPPAPLPDAQHVHHHTPPLVTQVCCGADNEFFRFVTPRKLRSCCAVLASYFRVMECT